MQTNNLLLVSLLSLSIPCKTVHLLPSFLQPQTFALLHYCNVPTFIKHLTGTRSFLTQCYDHVEG